MEDDCVAPIIVILLTFPSVSFCGGYLVNDTAVGGCNGEAAAFEVGEGTWNSTFIGNDGEEYDLDVFYATYDDQLWVRTLQVK